MRQVNNVRKEDETGENIQNLGQAADKQKKIQKYGLIYEIQKNWTHKNC